MKLKSSARTDAAGSAAGSAGSSPGLQDMQHPSEARGQLPRMAPKSGDAIATPTAAAQHSYLVALRAAAPHGGASSPFCAGALVGNRTVLTSAHCCFGRNASEVTLSLGGSLNLDQAAGLEVGARTVEIHAKFSPYGLRNSKNGAHDLCKITLAAPVPIAVARPIALDGGDADAAGVGATLSAAGWGSGEDAYGGAARSLALPVVAHNVCNGPDAYNGAVCETSMLCLGDRRAGAASCQADSGAPIVASNAAGGATLVGVASWGYGCDRADGVAVATRVAPSRKWIAEEEEA
jgi:secreted trypsin-like serine protease